MASDPAPFWRVVPTPSGGSLRVYAEGADLALVVQTRGGTRLPVLLDPASARGLVRALEGWLGRPDVDQAPEHVPGQLALHVGHGASEGDPSL